MPAW